MVELPNNIIENILDSKAAVDPFEQRDDIASIARYYSDGMKQLVKNSVMNPDVIPNLQIYPINLLLRNFNEGVDSRFAVSYLNLTYIGKVYEDFQMTFHPQLRNILQIENREILNAVSPYRAVRVASSAIDIFDKKVGELDSRPDLEGFYRPLIASQELETNAGFLLYSDDPVETAKSFDDYRFIQSTEEILLLQEIFRNVEKLDTTSRSYVSNYATNLNLATIDSSLNLYARELTQMVTGPRSDLVKSTHIAAYTGGSRVEMDNSAARAFSAEFEIADASQTISEKKAEEIILFIENQLEEIQTYL